MPDGPTILLILKVLVSTVTVLFAASLVALAVKGPKLHGRINTIFFVLTMTTVFGFELLLRFGIDVTSTFSPEARKALSIHLCFAVPAAILLPVMLFTGLKRRRSFHIVLGCLFTVLWLGTFVTGVFWLPHS
ncbi:hypothetical protein BH11PLA2_BH11PLA2_43070 [soil metagenome]